MSNTTNEAAYVRAPIAGQVITLTITTTAARFKIPAGFAGMPCCFIMEDGDADILWGDSTVAVAYGQASSVSSESITVSNSSGVRLQDGVAEYYVMPDLQRATHFSVDLDAIAGPGYLTIAITGGA